MIKYFFLLDQLIWHGRNNKSSLYIFLLKSLQHFIISFIIAAANASNLFIILVLMTFYLSIKNNV